MTQKQIWEEIDEKFPLTPKTNANVMKLYNFIKRTYDLQPKPTASRLAKEFNISKEKAEQLMASAGKTEVREFIRNYLTQGNNNPD